MSSKTMRIAFTITLALAFTSAHAAERTDRSGNTTFYDPAGRVTGKARTHTGGATTLYGPSGFVTGRAHTDSGGVTTFYDATGRVTGKAQPRR